MAGNDKDSAPDDSAARSQEATPEVAAEDAGPSGQESRDPSTRGPHPDNPDPDNPDPAGAGFFRRHRKGLTVLAVVCALALGTIGGYGLWLNSKLDNVERVNTGTIKDRPDPAEGKALNILLMGADDGQPSSAKARNTTLAEDAAAKEWPRGKYRSDTMMIVHISANRSKVSLVSIPRDTYTMIYDEQGNATSKQKINAALSLYGPNGAIATVEQLTNLRMSHVAVIDWEGFKDLSSAVGGVPVTIPESFYDPALDRDWKAGKYVLKGEEALQYVRTRYGLPNGDFDRIARQQNFLRSLMNQMLDRGTATNPVRLSRTLDAVTRNLTVDEGWSAANMRDLAASLRGIQADNVAFLTAPPATTQDVPGVGNVVLLDQAQSTELFTALRNDRLNAYLKKYPDALLGKETEID